MGCARIPVTIAAASTTNKTRLFLIGYLRRTLVRRFILCVPAMTSGFQRTPDNVSLPLVEPKDGPVKSAVGIHVFQCKHVVLLVGKQAHHSTASEGDRRLPERHRYAADLLALLVKKKVLDGSDSYLDGGLSTFVKFQRITLN